MDERIETRERNAAESLRRPPSTPRRLSVSFDNGHELDLESTPVPSEIAVEATDSAEQLADWFGDVWWSEVVRRWGESAVTVHIRPTPGALLQMVVLYQLEMICRVVPRWRLVGHAFRDDVATDDAIDQLVRSPYDEIRFLDAPRHAAGVPGKPGNDGPLDALFGRIRRAQAQIGTKRPILIRLPADAPEHTSTIRSKERKSLEPASTRRA